MKKKVLLFLFRLVFSYVFVVVGMSILVSLLAPGREIDEEICVSRYRRIEIVIPVRAIACWLSRES